MRTKQIAALVVLLVGLSLRTVASGSASNSVGAVEAPVPYFQASGYSYVRPVVIDHRQVANTDQTDFPFLISATLPDLATVANGGKVQNSNGYDIIFTSDVAGQTRLDHEIDSYNATTGAVGFWVRIPTLSHTTDTTIYMWYGNSGVTASQENKAGVWRNGYAAVWHFGGSTLSTSDSTANANNATNHGVVGAAGKFGEAGSFNGSNSTYFDVPSSNSFKPTASLTLEGWVYLNSQSQSYPTIVSLDYNASGSWSSPWDAYWLGLYSNTLQPRFSFTTNGPNSPNALPTGQWQHVVGTYDGSNMVVYTNGAKVSSTPQTGAIAYGTSKDLAIGLQSPYAPGAEINGLIDEVRISTVARSSDWIATEYNYQNSPSSFFQVCAATAAGSQPPPCSIQAPISSYSFFRQIVIDHTRVPNTDQTDFPFLISTTLPDLATVGNGGKVQSSNGYDIVFTSDAAGQNRLDHEIDSYDPTIGAAALWVRIPTLSHTTDTTIYMWYGSSAVVASQENRVGVWRNGYAGVWHLGNGGTVTATDSTGVSNGVLSNVSGAATAKIGTAASFPGTANSYIDIPGNSQVKPTGALTLEAWVNPNQVGNSNQIFTLDYRADGSWNSPWISYDLQSVNAAQIEFSITGASGSITRLDSAKTVPLSQWTHLVGTYDGTNLRLYENGAADTVTASTAGPIAYGTSKDLTLGSDTRYQTSAVNPWNGLLDEMRVSSVARSADWIAAEYNNQSSPSTSSAMCPATAAGSQPPSCSFSTFAIFGINPSSGPPGIAVTISGAGFGVAPGSVSFNGAAALINSWSSTTIVATVPAAATTGPLVVTTSSQATAQVSFAVIPAALTAADIGNVSAANSVSLNSGVYTVITHGSDIGGTSDSATFLYQKWAGDFDILVRVTSQQNSASAAKAGLMVRETLDPGSRNVFAFLTPTQGAKLAWRLTPGASETISTGASTALPSYWIRLMRRGNNFAALGSPDGQLWFALGSQTVFMAGTVYIGIGQTSNNAASNTATYDNYSAKSSALPSPWIEEDIGSPAAPGVSVFDGTSFFLDATGQDLGSTADPGAHFIYQPWTGDFDIKVHVAFQQNTASAAKMGLTARDSASNANVAVWITPAGSEGMSWRASPGASTNQINGAATAKAPNWVRLIRRGNNFSMYISPDGVIWQLQVAKTVSLASSVYLGAVATTSTSSGVPGTASALDTLQAVVPTAPAGVQSPWSEADIGSVNSAGNSSFDGLSTVVLSGGYDIYYPPDSFHFIYQSMSGDFDAAARFTYVENTDANAKIGLMVRSSLDPSAPYFGILDTSTNGAWPNWRYPTNPNTSGENGPAATATRPYWVRLVRRGNTFWSYGSTNGTTWTSLATQNITMTSPVYLGITASSHNTNSPLGNSAFDSLAIRSTSLTAVPKVLSTTPQTAGPLTQLTVQGSGFGATTGTVQINGVSAAAATWNDSTITLTVPNPAPTGPVVVIAADGTQSNSDVVFTGINPTVTSVSPSSGLPGDKVTINGSGFGQQQASLTFNGVAAPVLSWQDKQVVAYVPPSAQTGPVVITQSGVTSNNNIVFTVLAAQPSNGVAYGYDPLGRLTSVVDTSSNSGAIYSYDAVGNILSITRTSTTSPVSILSFNPSSGAPSSEVTIVGANFSSTPSQNTVSFNGAAATVFRSTPTTLLVSVPAGATSGPITVTSPGGSATSSSPFTVKSAGPAPVITGFNPAIIKAQAGVTITITGANFDPVAANNHVTVGNIPLTPTAATTTSLTVVTPAYVMVVTAAPINLQTSNGSTSSASNLFIVPAGIDPASVAYAAKVGASSTTTFSIPVSNQVGVLFFDEAAGRNIAVNMLSANFLAGYPRIWLYAYGNTCLNGGSGLFPFVLVLPATGTYALVVGPTWTAGSATVQMFDSTNLTGPVPANGTSFTITMTIPGQSGTFTFSTPTFSHLFWNETATTFAGCNMTINNPDGSTKSSMSCSTTSSNDLGEINEGPFTLSVVPTGMNTGSVTMNLVDIPDVSGTITINGASVNLTTTTPKQYGYVTFSGTASQGVTLKISSNITAAGTWFALQHLPDLANVYSSTVYSGSPISQSVTLPSTGNYRVVVAPGGSATGTLTITLTSP